MGQLTPEAIANTRAGSQQNQENLLLNTKNIVDITNKRASDVASFLFNGLKEKVFTDSDIITCENTRVLLDLKNRMESVKNFGAVEVSNCKWRRFFEAAKTFEDDLVCRIDADELKLQYRVSAETRTPCEGEG